MISKRLKKVGLGVLAILLALALVLTIAPITQMKVFAGTIAGATFDDNFDLSTGIDAEKWSLVNNEGKDISQNVLAGALRMKNMPAASSIITKTKVGTANKDVVMQFDIVDYAGQGGLMIVKGMDEAAVSAEDINDSYYQLGSDTRSSQGNDAVFDDYWQYPAHTPYPGNAWGGPGFQKGNTYKFVFKADGGLVVSIKAIGSEDSTFVEYVKSNGVDTDNFKSKFTKVGNGYAGFYFVGATPLLEIDNFSVADDVNGGRLEDNFEKEGLDPEKWVASVPVPCGPARSLSLKNKGDGAAKAVSVVSKANLIDYTSANVKTEINFKLKINELKDNCFSTVFGLDSSAMANKNTSFNIQAKKNDAGDVTGYTGNLAVNGVAGSKTVDLGVPADFKKDEPVKVKMIVSNNGINQDLTVLLNGVEKAKFQYIDLTGFFAFSIKSGTTETVDKKETAVGAINVEVDDLTFKTTNYVVAEGKNLYNDFSSAELSNEWHFQNRGIGGTDENPNPNGNGAFIKDGKLEFKNASDGTYFGPNTKYSNFDLTVELSDIVYEDIFDEDDQPIQSKSAWFGITFGRETLDAQYHGGDGFGATTLFFDGNPWGGGQGAESGRLYTLRQGDMPADDFSYDFANPWTKANQERGALTIRVKATNGTVEVFARYADEPASKLETPFKTLYGMQTNGYLALTCSEPTSYKVDNFNIKNTDTNGSYPILNKESGIKVDTSSVEKALDNGVNLDTSKLVVNVINTQIPSRVLQASEYTIDLGSFNKDVAGDYTITVKYKDFTDSFIVSVASAPVKKSGCGSAAMLSIIPLLGAGLFIGKKF